MSGSALLDQVTRGDHVCWIVDDEAVRLDTLAEVVQAGLRKRERVIYTGDDPEGILAAIECRGVPTAEALAAGSLRASTPESCLTSGGAFDPAVAMRLLREESDKARQEGFPGLRLIADMSWASRSVPGAERLPGFEAELNVLFAEGYLLGICAYSRRLFDPLSLRRHTSTHAGAAGTDMPFDPASALRLRLTPPYGLRLAGEADIFNRQALAAVIEHLVDQDDGSVAEIDVSDLRFADTAAGRILAQAVDRRAGGLRLVGASPALSRLLDFHGDRGALASDTDAEADSA
ncbi:MEDS domain-containing protein [Actinoplanes sp. NPDC051346]|uniref:MEDS domain-containing protein n=1 Tax=Actinoplanes sp. NPDC051346 TaxID=3155048 RepID=UPI00343A53EE